MDYQAQYIKERISETTDVPEEVSEVFSNLKQPFEGLDSEYLQTKYFKENFRLLVG